VQGHDLAGNRPPDPKEYTVMKGGHDAHIGRTLTAHDAGTHNALLPVYASYAPLNLKLGDTVTVAGSVAKTQVTVRIVGFYKSRLALEPIQVDNSVAGALANGRPIYAFYAYLSPDTADATLDRIQGAVPAAQTYSLAGALAQVASVLNDATLALVAIASLALLAGIVLIANAVALVLLERRRELGILKAMGYTSRGVLGAVLVENGLVGLVGGVLAMLLVAAATPLLGRALYDQPFGVPAPIVLAVVPGTALVCIIVAGSVAWRATRVRPLEVLRYE
jgi:ABC-type antimicrobial peptide transport system permease subunit